jgi:hypothetical protein
MKNLVNNFSGRQRGGQSLDDVYDKRFEMETDFSHKKFAKNFVFPANKSEIGHAESEIF